MTRPAALGLALALLGLAGCDANFTPQHLVRDLRILSIRAEVLGSGTPSAADADLGDTVRLSALVADPALRPDLRVEWFACLPQTGETVAPCLDPSALRDLDALAARPGVVRLGEGTSLDVLVPAALQPAVDDLLARASGRPELACSLYAELPVLAVARAGSEVRTAAKPARISPQRAVQGTPLAGVYPRNLNPVLVEVRAGPGDEQRCGGGLSLTRGCASDADCAPGVRCVPGAVPGPDSPPASCDDPLPRLPQTLCANATGGSSQPFPQCDPNGGRFPRFEELRWQWYATGGAFDTGDGAFDLGNATGDSIGFTPPAGPFTLWVIVRDGRGGESWLRREFR